MAEVGVAIATEVGVSVVARLAEYLVDTTVRQLQYLFCVGKITINVERKKEELIQKQVSVQERVHEAINRTDRIDGKVSKWQEDVERLIDEVENLEQELRANNGCLRGWCPTWRRYCLCKKLAKTTRRMIDLSTKSDNLNPFSHRVTPPDLEDHSSQNFKFFRSRQMAYDQLWEALQEDDISIIGLWGMGGLGKTTLVKEVRKKAKDSGLFDQVVFTEITENPDIRKIQGRIVDELELELKEESDKKRADRIALRLQNGERILMILDNVWTRLNLEKIGIPSGGNFQRCCKLVLTTRRLEVCDKMDCQKRIQLHPLKDDEAWTLFQTYANVVDDAAKVVARDIAMECKGLPIAIVVLGTCLKRNGVKDMNVMLLRLRNAMLNNVEDEDVRRAFDCLKLSYDYLATDQAKLLLLICAMFPEDHNIDVEDLFKYGVGLGLCKIVDSLETAREEVGIVINYLIDSSLLMDNSSSFKEHAQQCVKLHDVVRDVVLWIASEEHRTIMVPRKKGNLVVDEAVNDCYAFSSWYDNDGLLPFLSQLDAPKLEFLLLHSKKPLDISHAPFKGTKGLKALIIACTSWFTKIELQPQSIQHLSNLRTLRLRNWNLRDISFVVSLTRLEILDLQGSEFARVPYGIEKLNKLKLLDLSGCRIVECCCKVIGRCPQLEELYVSMLFPHSRNENCYEYLVGPPALKKLRRYELEIGRHGGLAVFQNKGIKYLCLDQLNTFVLGAIIKDLAQRAIAIHFYELEGDSKCFTPNIVQAVGGMNELTRLSLKRCSKIECITDETTPHGDTVLHRLDELHIEDMGNLKQLCLNPSPVSLFQKLERLSIAKCPQLLHIFPADCNLGNLKFLEIFDCPMLTSIFPISIARTLLSLEKLQIERCNELKHVLVGEVGGDAWGNSIFSKLRELSINDCCKLEYACPVFLVQKFEQLQRLSIKNAPWMKFVFGEEQPMYDPDETQIVLPPLKYLHLQELPNLVGICSRKYCLPQSALKTIRCWGCPNMELKGLQSRNEEYKPLAALEEIRLNNCGVEFIFYSQTRVEEQIPKFQYLEELTLENCARLKFVFSAHICQSLPKLTSLIISGCEVLETIFLWDEETQNSLSITEPCLLKLHNLKISQCNKLKYVSMISAATSMLPQLRDLRVSDCSQMEEIFKCSNIEDHDIGNNEREIMFPNMEKMELRNLPRLINVCQGFKLHKREISLFGIYNCPKLVAIKSVKMDCNENEYKWYFSFGDDGQEETNHLERFISELQMLGGLVPTQILSFQHLHSLHVIDSKKLKFLFSMSTIIQNNLPKLNSLILDNCEELEVIFGRNGEDDANYYDTIVLSSLRQIVLRNLPNFESVCQVGLQIQVELCDFSICNCPKFIDSSLGSTQQLRISSLPQVSIENSNFQTSPNSEEELRANEERGMMMISTAEKLKLENSMNLTSVWEAPTVIKFQTLKELTVSKCRRLKCILPSTVMRSLPCLEDLWIEECEELEEMMSSLCFPRLKYLRVMRCRKLKWLFPSLPSTQLLPQLEHLEIKECCQLKEMMSSEEEEHNHFPNNSLCIPQLRKLIVKRCRKLKWLFPSLPSTQSLPQLKDLHIEECCQLKGLFNCEPEIHGEGFYTNLLPNLTSLTVEDCPMFSETTRAALQSRLPQNEEIGDGDDDGESNGDDEYENESEYADDDDEDDDDDDEDDDDDDDDDVL